MGSRFHEIPPRSSTARKSMATATGRRVQVLETDTDQLGFGRGTVSMPSSSPTVPTAR